MAKETEKKDPKLWKLAKMRAEFKIHLTVYCVINVMLIAINLITSPNTLWFYWVSVFWGIGLVFHGLSVYVFKGEDGTPPLSEKEYAKLKKKQ